MNLSTKRLFNFCNWLLLLMPGLMLAILALAIGRLDAMLATHSLSEVLSFGTMIWSFLLGSIVIFILGSLKLFIQKLNYAYWLCTSVFLLAACGFTYGAILG